MVGSVAFFGEELEESEGDRSCMTLLRSGGRGGGEGDFK